VASVALFSNADTFVWTALRLPSAIGFRLHREEGTGAELDTVRVEEFDYCLPENRIAQEPLAERDASKLLVLHKESGRIEHRVFREIVEYLRPGDLLVLNNTKVIPARLVGRRQGGGRAEVLLLHRLREGVFNALVRPGQRLPVGRTIKFERCGLVAEVIRHCNDGTRDLWFSAEGDVDAAVLANGELPLPPYIHNRQFDLNRYQTVYATEAGSVAAPTAGLHFTPELLDKLKAVGVEVAEVTLEVGIGTFRPIKVDQIEEHKMHTERFVVPHKTVSAIEETRRRGGKVFAVGTTTVRALETAACKGQLEPMSGESDLYITPGHCFKTFDNLLTNFHMPKTSLLVLVSAFAGLKAIRTAYEAALQEGYRFLSLGDAMLILGGS
jgi:S-adenosylmethionine:tRNA ribosyltransferase-isomerase